MRFPEDKELHEHKRDQGSWRNCEELGDQDVVSDRGQTELDSSDRRQPTRQDDRKILHQLADVIIPPAPKDPEFVQQEMAGYADKVGD
jgi:hypothetical protein